MSRFTHNRTYGIWIWILTTYQYMYNKVCRISIQQKKRGQQHPTHTSTHTHTHTHRKLKTLEGETNKLPLIPLISIYLHYTTYLYLPLFNFFGDALWWSHLNSQYMSADVHAYYICICICRGRSVKYLSNQKVSKGVSIVGLTLSTLSIILLISA